MPTTSRGLDHIVVTVRDMDEATRNYQRMGFLTTPRMFHPFGTANHLMMFKTNFLEIIGVVSPADVRGIGTIIQKLSEQREGVSHFALQTQDAQADRLEFESKGLRPSEVSHFKRSVKLPDGRRLDAEVSVCVFDQSDSPRVMMFVSQQHVAEAVWVPEWQIHPNGAEDVKSVYIVSQNPAAEFGDRFIKLFGKASIQRGKESLIARLPNGEIVVLTPGQFLRCFEGADLTVESILPYIAAISVRVRDVGLVECLTGKNGLTGIRLDCGSLLVKPEMANGVAVQFIS